MPESDGVGWYLAQAGRIPMLTPAEEIELGNQVQAWQKIKDVENPTPKQKRIIKRGKCAKDRMLSANLRLVVHIAKKYAAGEKQHMSLLDLIQEGTIGLNRGVEKFDPSRGYKFSTYAYWWIRQGIHRSMGNQNLIIRLPVCAQDVQKRLKKYVEEYQEEHGKIPSLEQCATACRVTLTSLKAYMLHAKKPTSLDQPADSFATTGTGKELTLKDLIPCPRSSPNDELEIMSGLERLEDMLSELSDRDRLMIEMRYGLNGKEKKTYSMIAEQMGVSRERVRQVEIKGLKKMRLTFQRRKEVLGS
jgi:RNA polymerase primary sigma factor